MINNSTTGEIDKSEMETEGNEFLFDLLSSIFLQIQGENVPVEINIVMGMISAIMITCLSLTIVAWARELIGLT
jgi:hypothetical protein